MDGDKKTIVIVGGSLAGLMNGIMLKRIGHNVHILEQNKTSERAGYAAGIGTGPSGKAFLSEYDLTGDPYSFTGSQFRWLDSNSEPTGKFISTPLNLTGWDVVYYRLRANFDFYKSRYVPDPPRGSEGEGKSTFDAGKHVVDVEYDGEVVSVHFVDLIDDRPGCIYADFVVDASGTYSIIRDKLVGRLKQHYAGFAVWRGTVPEKDVSERTQDVFNDHNFNVFNMPNSYIAGYMVPGANGNLSPGNRAINYVWYHLIPEGDPFISKALTDIDGMSHRATLPAGKMRPEVWEQQKGFARQHMDPAFREVVETTQLPFLSKIRECLAPKGVFFDNRLILVGDGLNLMRPNAGMSFNQAAVQCFLLRKVFTGEFTFEEWERNVRRWGYKTNLWAKILSTNNLGDWKSYYICVVQYLFLIALERLSVFLRLRPKL